MITTSFALTATERVLPKLALDFTTESLDSRITFTRTTDATHPATYVNSSGYVAVATNNQPRFDYDPATLVCKGLLIEESRANLFARSNSFDAAYWTGAIADMTAVANSATSPDGTTNAFKFVPNTNNVNHFQPQTNSVTSGTAYTMSVFVKAAELDKFQMYMTTGFSAVPTATFNLTTGAITTAPTGNSSSATITSFGNGWYRCSITATADSTTTGAFRLLRPLSAAGTTPFAGNNVDGLYAYGAQLEAGAFATSYIPTTTTALTRNADVATMTGTNFSDWFNASEGTFEVEYNILQGVNTVKGIVNIFGGGSASDSLDIYTVNSSTTKIESLDNGASQFSYIFTTPSKACVAYKLNDSNVGYGGNAGTTDTSCTVPTLSAVNFGRVYSPASTIYFGNLHIKNFNYYAIRLINNELKAISK